MEPQGCESEGHRPHARECVKVWVLGAQRQKAAVMAKGREASDLSHVGPWGTFLCSCEFAKLPGPPETLNSGLGESTSHVFSLPTFQLRENETCCLIILMREWGESAGIGLIPNPERKGPDWCGSGNVEHHAASQ